jgi:hypothetical protein
MLIMYDVKLKPAVAETLPGNILKHSRCGVPGVVLNAPKPDENPSGVQGNRDEAMKTSSYMNLYES